MADETIAPSAFHAARELRVGISRLRRLLREVSGTLDLTPSQTSVLSRINLGGPASTSDLAAAERVRPQSMAATLAVLEQRRMIERTPDPTDGRRQLLALSAEGVARIQDHRASREEWLSRAFQERLTEDERQTVIEALGLLERLSEPRA